MSLAVKTTLAADEDIRGIVEYLEIERPSAAVKFGSELKAFYRRIAEYPDMGIAIPSLALRKLRVSERFQNWLVFYRRADEATLEIVRVLHSARDIPRLLSK